MRQLSGVLLLIIAAIPAAAQSRANRVPGDSQTVVFVCEHGTVKSVVAMAWFSRLARERGLPLRAISRGTALDPTIPGVVQLGLEGDGFDLTAFAPTRFTTADVAGAIAVISFDEPTVVRTVAGRVPTQSWDGLPSVMANYRLARDSIQRRVGAMVDSLVAR